MTEEASRNNSPIQEMGSARITTYEPDNSIKNGLKVMVGEIVREVTENKWLTWQLFKRDFMAMTKQSFLGIVWPLVIPLVSIGTFIILENANIFSVGDIDVPYPVFALLGMIVWQLFSATISKCSSSLVEAGAMLTKINFSTKSLVLSSLGQPVVSFLVQVVVLLVLLIIYQVPVHGSALLVLPLVVLPLLVFAVSLGAVLAVFNSIMRDISRILPLFLTFAMFLTPVLYAKPAQGILLTVTKINPLYYFVAATRDLVLKGSLEETTGFLVTLIASLIFSSLCLILFHLTEKRVAERV